MRTDKTGPLDDYYAIYRSITKVISKDLMLRSCSDPGDQLIAVKNDSLQVKIAHRAISTGHVDFGRCSVHVHPSTPGIESLLRVSPSNEIQTDPARICPFTGSEKVGAALWRGIPRVTWA